ncbi:hypothetical protein BBK36DRAFT_1114339 [Trichoderma citrinoviride]|uniref:Uncharacterized protein n=1 Tax=Trichoderma citrinoviride TaxID=58853 RepID=A0A2T4BEX2_9HYPO|nr:hypothetical protein BBK36DRAFT_1114339 [Trichoderma citrinoviride]PTB67884.1 hypothetical protein BBK36DRAFT_1114339 [Trichoderma citrinoviride]
MSRFVVMNEARQRMESAEPSITATNHPGGKAGAARQIPCATCVRRLTSNPPSQHQPCFEHLGRRAIKCFQCSSRSKNCNELPPNAVAFGREFQDATRRRFEGETVDDWGILGENTMQAINAADKRPVKPTRLSGIVPTEENESSVENDTSRCGQPQADSEQQQQQQPSIQPPQQQPQPLCQEELAQSNDQFPSPIRHMASRQDLQELRAQILHDVRQVLVESHQNQRQDDSQEERCAPPAPPAAEPPTEQNILNETVRDIIDAAQRSREGVATIVIHFH